MISAGRENLGLESGGQGKVEMDGDKAFHPAKGCGDLGFAV